MWNKSWEREERFHHIHMLDFLVYLQFTTTGIQLELQPIIMSLSVNQSIVSSLIFKWFGL